MSNTARLVTAGALVALGGFGPCSKIELDGEPPADAGAGSAGPANVSGAGECYFTSYPEGSKHCILGPCTIPSASPVACTVTGYINYQSGTTIYGAYPSGQTIGIYLDAATTFPSCTGGGSAPAEPSDAGDYYATGLEVGATSAEQLAVFCNDLEAPQFSADECYFTSYPEGSKQCITAPCTVTNAATLAPTCATDGGGYLNFLYGTAIYGTYPSGEITEIYPNAATSFPACVPGPSTGVEPADAGDYYATGLVVGSTSTDELAQFCAQVH